MENEQHHYELRSRSRSRSHTPKVPNYPLPELEVTEHHYDLRNKSRERSYTPGEVTSSKRSASKSFMETIEENREGSTEESATDNQSTKSENSTVTVRKAERRSERQRVKKQIFTNGQDESKENISNQKLEQKQKSAMSSRILTSDYSSEEGEKEDLPSRPGSAYEIYKQAGEWWNVFPKTDYTYSQASQCRYEIAPGVLAMPNMSRRPIHTIHQSSSQTSGRTTESGFSDGTETGSLIHSPEDNYDSFHAYIDSAAKSTVHRKTHIEQYTSHKEIIYSNLENFSDSRYFSQSNPLRYANKYGTYDSDLELDSGFVSSPLKDDQRWRVTQWFIYFTTFISTWSREIIKFFKFRTDGSRHYYDAQTYRSYHESKRNALWEALNRYLQNIYISFVRILVFDAWLLSQFTGIRKWLQEKSLKILWLVLLLLFLLLGYWCIAQYFSIFSAVKNISDTATETLSPRIQWNKRKRNMEETLDNNHDLVNRIKMLENGRIQQMEFLMNITQILEDRKQNDADFRKKYNDKIVENELDISELKNVVYNEFKVIKSEFEKLHELYSELKSCCDANMKSIADRDVEKLVEKILFNYLPSGTSKADLTKIIQSLFASHNKEDLTIYDNVGDVDTHMSEEYVRKIVKEILRIYDADKTGRVDYALESAGGQIISTRCTQRYDIKSRAFSLFGYTLSYEDNNPRKVIQGNPVQPGVCWAFQDFPGYLLIKLRSVIYVTGFTLEHVPRLILPNENMSSAPRKFNVWGLTDENDLEPVIFGDYEFIYSDNSLQYFPVQNMEINRPYEYVELRIHSNHGQLEYTCLYRFRVHGKPA